MRTVTSAVWRGLLASILVACAGVQPSAPLSTSAAPSPTLLQLPSEPLINKASPSPEFTVHASPSFQRVETTTPGLELPTAAPSVGSLLTTASGPIHFDAGTGCVVIASGASRLGVVWPSGYSAQLNPLRIYDDAEQVVAAEGAAITVGGPLVAKDDLLPQCHVDSVWEFQHANV